MSNKELLLKLRTDLLLYEVNSTPRPLTEKLDRSDKKEIEKMIQKIVASDYKKNEKSRKKEMETFAKSRDFKSTIEKLISGEVEKQVSGKVDKEEAANITKAVLRKLYRELAYNYTPVIDRIKV